MRLSRLLSVLALVVLFCASCAAPNSTQAPVISQRAAMWIPAVKTSWQIQLSALPIAPFAFAEVYDIDGFDASAHLVAQLHAQHIHVFCYIDVGSWENFRPDAGSFPAQLLGKTLDGYPDERWLDIRQIAALAPIITARMRMCKNKGFDAIDPDNVNGYENDTGFPLTAQEQIQFNLFIAQTAHTFGLSVGLKNDIDQIPVLLPNFDWALNEQCFEYQECSKLLPFTNAGKAVFEIEYNLKPNQFCSQANALNFNSLYKNVSLDAFSVSCR